MPKHVIKPRRRGLEKDMLDKVLDRENREGFKERMEMVNSLQEKEQAIEESEAEDDLENVKASGKTSGKKDIKCFRCKLCKKTWKKKLSMAEHVCKPKNRKMVAQFDCPKCDEGFFSKADLGLHKQTHIGLKPYKCDRCEKRFKSPDGLEIHNRLFHRGVVTNCHHCSKCFFSAVALASHVSEIHSNQLHKAAETSNLEENKEKVRDKTLGVFYWQQEEEGQGENKQEEELPPRRNKSAAPAANIQLIPKPTAGEDPNTPMEVSDALANVIGTKKGELIVKKKAIQRLRDYITVEDLKEPAVKGQPRMMTADALLREVVGIGRINYQTVGYYTAKNHMAVPGQKKPEGWGETVWVGKKVGKKDVKDEESEGSESEEEDEVVEMEDDEIEEVVEVDIGGVPRRRRIYKVD